MNGVGRVRQNLFVCKREREREFVHGISVTRFGDSLNFGQVIKPLATIKLPKSPTFLGYFCKGVKIDHFPNEIIFRQLL